MSKSSNGKGGRMNYASDVLDYIKSANLSQAIRYNVRTQKIEFWGKELRLDTIEATLYLEHGISAPQSALTSAFLYTALQNKYDPFKEFLLQTKLSTKIESIEQAKSIISSVSLSVLGVENRLYIEYIKCFLVGMVARTFEPACKHDDALILQGKQGIGKSSFFRVLVGDQFFSDGLTGNLDDKDMKMLMQRFPVLEWSELDKQFGRDRTESIKARMRAREDDIRLPYSKDVERLPRRSVLVGTTNEKEFLSDKTGNRTFHVVPLHCTVDLASLQYNRIVLIAAAIYLYEQGEPHYIASEEMKQAQIDAVSEFEKKDPWLETVEDYVTRKLQANPLDWFKSEEFLVEKSSTPETTPTKVLREFDDARNDRSSQMRLAAILTQLGLTNKKRRLGKETFWCWCKQ
jgi:predicted P-loop ATPase